MNRGCLWIPALAGAALAVLTPMAAGQGAPNPRNGPIKTANPEPFDATKFPLQQWRPDTDLPAPMPDHPPIDKVPPMPMPDWVPPPRIGPPSLDSVTLHDAETGKTVVLPLGDPRDPVARVSENPYYGADQVVSLGLEMQRGMGSRTAVSDATLATWPARTNVRLLMRYVDNTGANRFFVCSGSMIDGGVVLTAAHCVYAREADGPDIFDWAQEIWVYPGWDGSGNSQPNSTDIIQTWGWARGTFYMAGSGYVNSGDWDRDVGLIRLNRANTRSVGMLTGWYGWGLNLCNGSTTHYNYSYPAESCSASLHTGRQMYFWDGTIDGCPGLFNGNQYDLDTSSGCHTAVWGGMSGSSMNRFYDGGGPFSVAVCSTSNRSSDANYCALWDQFVDDMNNDFKPGTRGNTFDIEALQYRTSSTTVVQGSNVAAGSVQICNTTDNNPGSRQVTLHVYLSSNTDVSTSDTLLATYNYNNVDFGAMDCIQFNVPATQIPYNTPTGSYYVGVIIDSSEDTNSANNDTDTWDADPITVSCLTMATPGGVSASDGTSCAHVAVSWNAVTGASSYFVYRNTVNSTASATLIATVNAPTTSYNDTGASSAGTTYYYWVRADSNCSTSGYSTANTGYRNTTPVAPTGVAASDSTNCGLVSVSWNAVSNATTYSIYRNTVNSTAGATLLGSDNASPYSDATGVAGTTYYYFVRAGNACGTSGYSTGNAGRAQTPASPPTVNASDGTLCTGVAVTWNAATQADSYYVYRNTVNNTGTATLLVTTAATNYTDNAAVVGTTYYYWVRSNNECGPGNYSTVNTGYRGTAPAVPTNVSATDGIPCTPAVTISWTAPATASGYQVFRNIVNNSATATQIATVFSPNTTYDDATALPNTLYYYWVKATNACGVGAFSAPDTGNRGAAPPIPTGVNATDGVRCNSVVVSWTASTGATGYEIWRNTVNNSATAVMIGTDNASPFSDNTVVGATVYFYWVRATNSCGTSGFSTSNSGFGGVGVFFDLQPSDLTVFEGNPAQFSVLVGGATAHQWRKNGVNISNGPNITGATTNTLTILSATEGDEGVYTCFVTTPCGTGLSDRALLTVDQIPCPADYNQDGGIDGADVDAFYADWEAGDLNADVNQDGGVDGADVDYFFEKWEAGGC